jgi:hypothetical protein
MTFGQSQKPGVKRKMPDIYDHKSFYSMAVLIPKTNWRIVDGEKKPTIDCPLCGLLLLGDTAPHGVLADGTVHASVVCPHSITRDGVTMPCGFHSNVRLVDWNGGIIAHR